MQLPNKLYSYKNSTLEHLPCVLKKIENAPVPVEDLYQYMRPYLEEPTDFLAVMDCLYALNAADINEKDEVYICLSK